jgi:hypothetical protein
MNLQPVLQLAKKGRFGRIGVLARSLLLSHWHPSNAVHS